MLETYFRFFLSFYIFYRFSSEAIILIVSVLNNARAHVMCEHRLQSQL